VIDIPKRLGFGENRALRRISMPKTYSTNCQQAKYFLLHPALASQSVGAGFTSSKKKM
jgi:hypothetical protein